MCVNNSKIPHQNLNILVTPRTRLVLLWREHPKNLFPSVATKKKTTPSCRSSLCFESGNQYKAITGRTLWQLESVTKWQVSGGNGVGQTHTTWPSRQNQQNRARSDWSCPHSAAMSLAETGFLSTRTALSLVLAVPSIIRAPRGDAPLVLRKEVGWVMWNMPLKTSVSLHSHQIFTVLYYSGLAVWQKCIMWTSCGWHGNIGSCNNCVRRKIEKDQMYQQEINNWKLLILVLSAPQSSGRQTMHAGFYWK